MTVSCGYGVVVVIVAAVERVACGIIVVVPV